MIANRPRSKLRDHLIFEGVPSQDWVRQTVRLVNHTQHLQNSAKKKTIMVSVETIQNMIRHCEFSVNTFFGMEIHSTKTIVTSKNAISNENKLILQTRLSLLLDENKKRIPQSIKEYIETIDIPTMSFGLFMIIKNTGGNIEFGFSDLNAEYALFWLKCTIHNTNDDRIALVRTNGRYSQSITEWERRNI